MKLFTNKEEKILKQLLSCAVDQGEVLSLTSLHGFLYCLAIIPETVVPSEWRHPEFPDGNLIGLLNWRHLPRLNLELVVGLFSQSEFSFGPVNAVQQKEP